MSVPSAPPTQLSPAVLSWLGKGQDSKAVSKSGLALRKLGLVDTSQPGLVEETQLGLGFQMHPAPPQQDLRHSGFELKAP